MGKNAYAKECPKCGELLYYGANVVSVHWKKITHT